MGVEFDHIQAAATRIGARIHRTPVQTSSAIDRLCGRELFFKCENLQKVGAFKIRGAANAILSLSDAEAAAGVCTHSSGNHAQALALAARWRGVAAHVVMPRSSAAVKRDAVAGYGAQITLCEPTLEAREQSLAALRERTGATFIHPYDDERIIAGQGSAALELCEQVPELDAVLAPVGGGGLLSGTALAVAALAPRARVYGAEPRGADDAWRSLRAGRIIPSVAPRTIADGLLTSLGERNFPIIQRLVAGILVVSEEEIVRAMRLIWERMKLVVEPSAAVPLAAVLAHELEARRIGIILSGGNVDLEKLPWS